MRIKCMIAGLLIGAMAANVNAQSEHQPEKKGKAIINVFGNFHSGFGRDNDNRGFDLERVYLGYEYKLKGGLSIKGVTDIGKSSKVDDYQRIVYIKNAQLSWKKDKLTLNAGLISTTQFNYQEKFWGHRYVMKSFQDEYKYGSSADLGLSASYQWADWIATDVILVNGEGYKKIQVDDGLNYGVGVTLTPVKGLSVRLYGGMNEVASSDGQKDVFNFASFVGYQCKAFRIGAEYNLMQNSQFTDGADVSGISLYSSVNIKKIASVFARYDNQFSKHDWNKEKDESTITLGSEFKIGKYVKIAPNLRMAIPKADGAKNAYAGYVSCYFGI